VDPLIARDLDTLRDFIELVVIAAVLGAVAGVVGELIIGRGKSKESGRFELPQRTARWLDLGSFSAIPVGALAAVLTSLVAVPTHEVTVDEVSTIDYDLARLVVLALAAGLAGGAVLAKFQEGLTAVLTAERLKTALGVADQALAVIQNQSSAGAAAGEPGEAVAPELVAAGVGATAATARQQIQRALLEERD
jgi:hypothetical protein